MFPRFTFLVLPLPSRCVPFRPGKEWMEARVLFRIWARHRSVNFAALITLLEFPVETRGPRLNATYLNRFVYSPHRRGASMHRIFPWSPCNTMAVIDRGLGEPRARLTVPTCLQNHFFRSGPLRRADGPIAVLHSMRRCSVLLQFICKNCWIYIFRLLIYSTFLRGLCTVSVGLCES